MRVSGKLPYRRGGALLRRLDLTQRRLYNPLYIAWHESNMQMLIVWHYVGVHTEQNLTFLIATVVDVEPLF